MVVFNVGIFIIIIGSLLTFVVVFLNMVDLNTIWLLFFYWDSLLLYVFYLHGMVLVQKITATTAESSFSRK
jgi:hypothetical protein